MSGKHDIDREAYRSWLYEELIDWTLRLEPIRKMSSDAIDKKDCLLMKGSIRGLLMALFGDDVTSSNIRQRLEFYISNIEASLTESEGVKPIPGKNSIVEAHILFAQRILTAYLGLYVRKLEKQWVDSWPEETYSEFNSLTMLHDALLKFALYVKTIPIIVSLRSLYPQFEAESNLTVSMENVVLDPDAGKVTITLDIMQPKENLMIAFEQLVDVTKKRLRENPDNLMLMNLYDFSRKKDGRRNKSLFSDWRSAIHDFEDASEYQSLYAAAKDLTVSEEEDTENLRKNLGNRLNRYYMLLDSIMKNSFPCID